MKLIFFDIGSPKLLEIFTHITNFVNIIINFFLFYNNIMYIFKDILLVTHNSSWWKQKKYRRESAIFLAKQRSLGWRFIKKELLEKSCSNKDTRTFSIYYLKKRPR